MKEEGLPARIYLAYRDGIFEYEVDFSHQFKLAPETGRVDRGRYGHDVCRPYVIPSSFWKRVADSGDIFEDIDIE